MMNSGGEAANRRYGAKGASQTGRYIVMTRQFGNKLHSNCKSQPVKLMDLISASKIARQDLGWSEKEELDRELDHKSS